MVLACCGWVCVLSATQRLLGQQPTTPTSDALPASSAKSGGAAPQAAATVERPFVLDDNGNRIPVTVGAAPGYVPDQACQSCHAVLYADYQHVGMSRSTFVPSADNVIEDFQHGHFYHKASDRHYEMTLRDGKYFQKRYQLDEDGNRINEIEVSADLVIGSGKTVRTYATRTSIGELYQLPVSWYTQTKRWAMSPGYDTPDHAGFLRQVKRECLFCHNAYPEQPAGSDTLGHPFTFPAKLPSGIGCQRCHGPGAAHLRVAYDPSSGVKSLRESIVNPARLEPQLRDDVCYQCHLQPSVSPTSFMRVIGRGDYSYKPGEPLENYVYVVDYQDEEKQRERFEINHHPYRLRQSPCYIKSGGAMSCMTCHDPHRKPLPSEKVAYYRNACLTCHTLDDCHVPQKQPEGGDCAACHMALHRTEDVIEIVATDHLIQRNPPKEAFLAPRKVKPKQKLGRPHPYFPDRVADRDTLALHMGLLAARQKNIRLLKPLEDLIKETDPDTVEPYLYLATVERYVGKYDEAETAYRTAIEKHVANEAVYTGLSHVLVQQERYEASIEAARTAISMNPVSPDAFHLLGVALQSLGRTNEAGPMFQRALQLRPFHNDARSNLGKAFASVGDLDHAVQAQATVITINPPDIPAYVDLATLLVYQGHYQQALKRVRHGIKINPAAFRLHETLGLLLAIGHQYDPAMASAKKARELGAGDVTYAAIEAAWLLNNGDERGARASLRKAKSRGTTNILRNKLLAEVRADLAR